MDRLNSIKELNNYKKIARDRYYCIGRGSEGELFENNALLIFGTTKGKTHVVEIDKDDAGSDDVSALLEWALHDIKDRTAEKYFDEVVYQILGAIKNSELDESDAKHNEYTPIDLGYVIPGLIDFAQYALVEDEQDPHDRSSSFAGDYGPSCPWNAPGMSISDFI